MQKYRLTFFFAATALVVIAVAAIIVNHIIGDLAEDNLIRIAEENTARDAVHMQAMMRRHDPAYSVSSGNAAASANAMGGTQQPMPLTLEFLTGPGGLDRIFPMLVEGLHMVKFNLFDLNGTTVWSTDPGTIGITQRESPLLGKAVAGEASSKILKDHEVVHLDGVPRSIDVVETYLPLREAREGRIIGTMEIYRDVSDDVTFQVENAETAVLWTTVGTMGGLFLVLLGFIVVADTTIYRSRRRELLAVEEANRTLEDRVLQRTQELSQAQDRLVRSEKLAAIGQMAGGVAHDLRNPLGAINSAVYYLKRRLAASEVAKSNPKIGEFLEITEDAVAHSNKIIGNLLSYSRVNAPSLSPTDLGATIESALARTDTTKNVRAIKWVDLDLPEVLADGGQLRRVFVNLANNAYDAMPEGGELTVTAQVANGFVQVAFRDTGMGISEEDLKKVFDPLFTTKANGTGLGLALCQEIVTKHGGTIGVESAHGQGATFTVTLPIDHDAR